MMDDKIIPFTLAPANPNVPIPVRLPAIEAAAFGDDLPSMDIEAFFNMRDWLTAAVEAKGAKKVGGGIGCGQADIDIDLDGCRYNISIRPLPARTPQDTKND